MKTRVLMSIYGGLVLILSGLALAQTQVPNTFQSGQPASAADVNANFDALEGAVDQNIADVAANQSDIDTNSTEITNNVTAIQNNAAAIQALDSSVLQSEIQTATDYGRRGMSSGDAGLSILQQLINTLGLTCAEANYGRFFACTQITAGDGTVWPIDGIVPDFALAYLILNGVARPPEMPMPLVFVAQTNSGNPGDMLVAGTANFLRWTYRDADDTARLVDDCDNPQTAMSPVSLGATSSRWRVNNGAYYYVPFNTVTGTQELTGELDVTGQMVGIVRNINPFSVFDANAVEWCVMSDQVTGLYNTYELQPFPFNLNDPQFSLPMTIQ